MVYIKTKEEIEAIRSGGRILGGILAYLITQVRPGVSTALLEAEAERLIESAGGRPAFKGYPLGEGLIFPTILCVSINHEVVHGSALPERIINAGDVVDIDIGMEWPIKGELRRRFNLPLNQLSPGGGFYTDTCATAIAGAGSPEAKRLVKVTRECLEKGIAAACPGRRLNDIGRAVQEHAEKNGLGVVRDLVGHGVGYEPHEDPHVFNFVIPERSPDNLELEPGMVIAIEPMLNLGTHRVKTAKDGYTVLTADGSLSAHFEHTVAITESGPQIMTAA